MTAEPRPVADPAMPDMPTDAERTRGRYRYTRDGADVGVDERFVLGEIAPGVVRVRSTRVSATPTSRLEADVRFSAGVLEARLRWVGSSPGVARSADAGYVARDGAVSVTRTVDGRPAAPVVVAGTAYPLMRVFTGPLVLASAGGLDLVTPDVADPTALVSFLAPVASRRTAEPLGARTVLVDGVGCEASVWRWVGGAYGEEGAEFAVDAGGLLLEYAVIQPSGRWEVSLAEVSGPWPAPAHWPR